MAIDRYTGKDVKITFNSFTANFRSIEIRINMSKFEAPASDATKMQRGDGLLDASITIRGWDSDATNSAAFDDVAALVISRAAPSALTYTDNAGTPASKLPSTFFTAFPLTSWRVDEATGGTGGPTDPNEWSITLSPGNFSTS